MRDASIKKHRPRRVSFLFDPDRILLGNSAQGKVRSFDLVLFLRPSASRESRLGGTRPVNGGAEKENGSWSIMDDRDACFSWAAHRLAVSACPIEYLFFNRYPAS